MKNLVSILFFVLLPSFLFPQEVAFIAEKNNVFFGAIKISGLNKNEIKNVLENDLIKIYLKELYDLNRKDLPPMLGEFIAQKNTIYFRPRFPFLQSKKYVVEITGKQKIIKSVLIPSLKKSPVVSVAECFPSINRVPANLLKMYIQFSGPMGLGDVYEHIKLFSANEVEVREPFLEIKPPLWDSSQQRLTLWFDPGRIKKELAPHELLGPPLKEEGEYKLVVSKKMKDAHGRIMEKDFEKKMYISAADREKPNVEKWEIKFPPEPSCPLKIRFNEYMDYGTLYSGIGVVDEKGRTVPGAIAIVSNELQWDFYPERYWQKGKYFLMVSEKIEDLAGNNLIRLFDEKYEAEKINQAEGVLEIPFEIK
ncbi:MAG: Ig-like domain-containing protein [Bacteroidota bacterium]